MSLKQQLKRLLTDHPEISLAILFGSLADSSETPASDIDIAVAGLRPLDAAGKQELIEAVTTKTLKH